MQHRDRFESFAEMVYYSPWLNLAFFRGKHVNCIFITRPVVDDSGSEVFELIGGLDSSRPAMTAADKEGIYVPISQAESGSADVEDYLYCSAREALLIMSLGNISIYIDPCLASGGKEFIFDTPDDHYNPARRFARHPTGVTLKHYASGAVRLTYAQCADTKSNIHIVRTYEFIKIVDGTTASVPTLHGDDRKPTDVIVPIEASRWIADTLGMPVLTDSVRYARFGPQP